MTGSNRFFNKLPDSTPHLSASSPDRAASFNPETQNRWKEFSYNVINTVATNLDLLDAFHLSSSPSYQLSYDSTYPHFLAETKVGRLFAYLYEQRQKIANEINSKKADTFKYLPYPPRAYTSEDEEWHTKHAMSRVYDDFTLNRLPTQRASITACLDRLINLPNKKIKVFSRAVDPENILLPVNRSKFGFHVGCYRIEVPLEKNENGKEKLIIVYDEDVPEIQVFHPCTRYQQQHEKFYSEQLKLAQTYFEACQQWKPDQPIGLFLQNIGRLTHIFAQLELPMRGNSAVVEWMMHGLAKNKGIDLGNFSLEIGWDFKAFLTPDREEYSIWFANNAFVEIKMTNKVIDLRKNELEKARLDKFSKTDPKEYVSFEETWNDEKYVFKKNVIINKVLAILKKHANGIPVVKKIFENTINKIGKPDFTPDSTADVLNDIIQNLAEIPNPNKLIRAITLYFQYKKDTLVLDKKLQVNAISEQHHLDVSPERFKKF